MFLQLTGVIKKNWQLLNLIRRTRIPNSFGRRYFSNFIVDHDDLILVDFFRMRLGFTIATHAATSS